MLIEHSVTTVPANVGAVSLLRSAKKNGLLRNNDIHAIRELERRQIANGPHDLKLWKKREAQWLTIWNSMFPEVKFDIHQELDVPIPLVVDSNDGLENRIARLEQRVKDMAASVADPEPPSEPPSHLVALIESVETCAKKF